MAKHERVLEGAVQALQDAHAADLNHAVREIGKPLRFQRYGAECVALGSGQIIGTDERGVCGGIDVERDHDGQ